MINTAIAPSLPMPSPFPGMNPYLEDPQLWPEVHSRLVVAIADVLNPQVMPKYRVAVERRVYEMVNGESVTVGIPDVTVSRSLQTPPVETLGNVTRSSILQPRRIVLPMPEEVRESYLEIKDVATGLVVTVIELLSPKNKKAGPGREAYEAKRRRVLGSRVHLVEIDLLRAGRAMAWLGTVEPSLYSVIVSRAEERPGADFYGFGLQEGMPTLLIPLRAADEGASLDLQQVLQTTYERAGFDLAIDYGQPPPPPQFSEADQAWLTAMLDP